jgi:hypothetical protein
MTREKYVTASEIGSYVFCRRAWHLDQRGVSTTLRSECDAGVEFHHQHGIQVHAAGRTRNLSAWFALAAIVLTGLALLLAFQ